MTVSTEASVASDVELDPATLAVMANRFETITREMTNTLLRSARSTVIAIARDLSCCIVTAEDELVSSAEAVPVHVFGGHLQTAAMRELHPDMREGDAFLDNDPYVGNTHHADHSVLVPVFIDGEHMFTALAKAHVADCGNSAPTTYMAWAKDIYEEGALCFPCVQVQRDYQDIDDIIRMCRRRIRVPDQWYGDYLATLGAARIAERRLKELVAKYGKDRTRAFLRQWLDYSERRMIDAIRKLPSGRVVAEGQHDPFGDLEEIPVRVELEVDADEGRIVVDLRSNIDTVEAGINLSRATAANNAITGVMNVLDSDLPVNSGTFRRIEVLLREGSIAGIPIHPTSCSVATTNVGGRLINLTQAAIADIGEGLGAAQSGTGFGTGLGVLSGYDWRTGGPYVNQVLFGVNGGPATPDSDGWLTFLDPVAAGLIYSDSIEQDEEKYPVLFRNVSIVPDSGGAGRQRGAPCGRVEYGPRHDPLSVAYVMDGHVTPARGVRGGRDGSCSKVWKEDRDGRVHDVPTVGQVEIVPGEHMCGTHGGGGGYGDPLERDPALVLQDVGRAWVSPEAARDIYGVWVSYSEEEGWLVDEAATKRRRAELAGG